MFKEKLKRSRDHKKAFLKIEKELTGKNTLRGKYHDSDKIIMYKLHIPLKLVKKIHRMTARHHINSIWDRIGLLDYRMAIIDWECGRYTKPDMPLSALEYLNKIKYDIDEIKYEKLLKTIKDLGLKK